MSEAWLARFEEGYVTTSGERVTLTNRLHRDQRWQSPMTAMRHWASAGLDGPGIQTYLNGVQQTLDVGSESDFAALKVRSIWRRVSFERISPGGDGPLQDSGARPQPPRD
jgi:hypothetical protein